jgi:16S rRNA processing protein RimM
VLGRISGVFGIKGWFKVHSFTDPREAILNYRNWLLDDGGTWHGAKLEEGNKHGRTIVARIAGVTDREQATRYVGNAIAVPSAYRQRFAWGAGHLPGLR